MLRTIQGDIVISVKTSSCEIPAILIKILMTLEFSWQILEKAQMLSLLKTCSVGAELLHAN
jgi:hypothetical protein